MFAFAALRRLTTTFAHQQFLNWSEGREWKRYGREIRLWEAQSTQAIRRSDDSSAQF